MTTDRLDSADMCERLRLLGSHYGTLSRSPEGVDLDRAAASG
jgi:hypothetical protein